MIVCFMTGLAVFLYLLPSCFAGKWTEQRGLFIRIEVEKNEVFQSNFVRALRGWPGLKQLQTNRKLLHKLAGIMGIDMQKTALILSRLRWDISMEEITLIKLIAGVCLVITIGFTLVATRHADGLTIGNMLPAILAVSAFLFPTKLLDWADERAKNEIRDQVPVFFSVVQALVEAGMPIQSAVRSTAKRFDTRLGREFTFLDIEEKRYGNWRKALEELAYRWDVDSLISISLEINEAIKKGVSIAANLAVQIEEQLKQQEDQAAAHMNRLNVRLLPFVILFMGVPLFFLVMGPAFMGIKESL